MQKVVTIIITVAAIAIVIFIIVKNLAFDNKLTTNRQPLNNPMANDLQIETLAEGSGQAAESGNTVTVHYVGTLADGTKFDSSIDKGTPFSFVLGAGRVIKGWDQGVLGMKIGEKRRLTVPSSLGYGPGGYPPVIPPNATLIFEVELLSIQ